MKMFDPHIHMTSRTTDDYAAMAKAGINAVIEPAFWMGQPRTNAGTYEDYFMSIVEWERFRAKQFGIHHFATIALNPKEANNLYLADDVIKMMPRFLTKESVVAVGEIGLDDQSDLEEKYFALQCEMAKEYNLPILVHTPHRDKKQGTQRCLDIVKESNINPEMVLIDHNNEQTIKGVRDRGHWAGHSIYPFTKMDSERMSSIVKEFGSEKIIINSAADWGVSDPLMVPKTVDVMLKDGISEQMVSEIVWNNPYNFFNQSGKLEKLITSDRPKINQAQLFEGNSVLRGQEPVIQE